MQCRRCQCELDGFRTLGELRQVVGIDSEGQNGDGLCARCRATCELCGLGLNRPLTDDQVAAALTLPLTLPRPSEPEPSLPRGVGRYRLCVPCRALQDTTKQQQGRLRIGSLSLDGPDEQIGRTIRDLLLRYLDRVPDAEIGAFIRLVAQGDMVKVAKAAAKLVQGHAIGQ